MAKVKFTAGRVADFTCEMGKSQAFMWSAAATGLGLRATPRGDKSYFFQSKLNGRSMRITIGSPDTWTIDAAQAEARRLQSIIDNGQDPRQIKADELAQAQDARAARQAAIAAAEAAATAATLRESTTFGQVWAAYLDDRKAHWGERHYQDHVKKIGAGGIPAIRGTRGRGVTIAGPLHHFVDMPISSIDSEIVEKWAKLEGMTRPTSARLAWRMLKVFFQWCYENKAYAGLLPQLNPGKTKKSRELLGKAKAKQDNIQSAQLPGWFDAVRKLGNPTVSAYLQTLLLSGARPGEILEMQWSDINWKWESIVIRDKIEGTRTIPLTPFVRHLLDALPRRPGNEYVFSSAQAGVKMIGKPHLPHKLACEAAGLQGLTLHGLRRSFASLAEQTEAPGGVAAQIQGHKPQSAREKSYIVRPLDFLRKWHVKIEADMLEQAGVTFTPTAPKLHAVA